MRIAEQPIVDVNESPKDVLALRVRVQAGVGGRALETPLKQEAGEEQCPLPPSLLQAV